MDACIEVLNFSFAVVLLFVDKEFFLSPFFLNRMQLIIIIEPILR